MVNLKGFVSLKGAHVSGTARFALGGDWEWTVGFGDIVMKERTSTKEEWDYKRAEHGSDASNIARRWKGLVTEG